MGTPANGDEQCFYFILFLFLRVGKRALMWAAPHVADRFALAPQGGSSIISIHAPRVGSDKDDDPAVGYLENFNTRPPRGERQLAA